MKPFSSSPMSELEIQNSENHSDSTSIMDVMDEIDYSCDPSQVIRDMSLDELHTFIVKQAALYKDPDAPFELEVLVSRKIDDFKDPRYCAALVAHHRTPIRGKPRNKNVELLLRGDVAGNEHEALQSLLTGIEHKNYEIIVEESYDIGWDRRRKQGQEEEGDGNDDNDN